MKETQIDPPESGAENYRLALETVPDHPVALRALELAYLRARNWPGLVALYHRDAMLNRDEQRKVVLYNAERPRWPKFGSNATRRPPSCTPRPSTSIRTTCRVCTGRRRIAERAQDTNTVLMTLQAEGAVSADVAHAKEVLFEAARVRQDALGDINGAIETYKMVLQRAPDHLGAFNRLEAIYLEREAWPLLLDLLKNRSAAVSDRVEQAKLLATAGEITQDRLRDIEGAMGLYREVLNRDEHNAVALIRLGPALFEREEWDEAADVFHRTLSSTKDSHAHLLALKSLGIIYQEHRKDSCRRCTHSRPPCRPTPPTPMRCGVSRRLYQGAKDWNSAVNVLLRLAEAEPSQTAKVKTLLELGKIYAEGAKDRKNAILAYRKVMQLDPGNAEPVLQLTDLYEQDGDWQALAEVTAMYVKLLAPEEKHKAAPLHLKMADVFENRLNDDKKAINALKYALEAKPDLLPALEQMARLYAKKPDTYPQAVQAHRHLLRLDPFRVDSYHEMHRMFERLGQHDKAFVVAEVLVLLRAQQQDEDLYYHEHKSRVAPAPSAR